MWPDWGKNNVLLSVGKRPAEPASEGRAGAEAHRQQMLVGNLHDDGAQLSAVVGIGVERYKATIDTGATSSFISEELSRRLGKISLRRTMQRQIRLVSCHQPSG